MIVLCFWKLVCLSACDSATAREELRVKWVLQWLTCFIVLSFTYIRENPFILQFATYPVLLCRPFVTWIFFQHMGQTLFFCFFFSRTIDNCSIVFLSVLIWGIESHEAAIFPASLWISLCQMQCWRESLHFWARSKAYVHCNFFAGILLYN